MKNQRKLTLFPAIAYVLTLVTALFWVALRVNHSGISKFLGADDNQSFLIMNLPVMVCVVAWIGFLFAVVGIIAGRRWPSVVGLVIGLIMLIGGVVVVYFGAWDYLTFILPHFWKSLAVAAALTVLALLLFFPITGKGPAATVVKWVILALALAVTVKLGYQLRPCSLTYGAVVYAVEDDYQIVFSTSDSAMAWVTIGGEEYYDLYAGSSRSVDKVHKVTVPQSVLDAAGGYTIHARQMIYRGPFGGYMGKELTRDYSFRPVDPSDGLNYAALSDVHGAVDAAARAASDDSLDFLVLLGDIVSMVETEKDAQLANQLAHSVTGGQIPVIYARGNHEIKGEYSEVLYKYVGSLNQSFAYTVTLGDDDVFAVVLDMGEDHEDDWWEYYGTAQFDRYRAEQSEMLRQVLADGEYENYNYRMALCHIPVVYVEKSGKFGAFREEWTGLLNQLGTDISLGGHKHKLWQFLPGTLTPGEPLVYSEAYYGKAGKAEGGTVYEFTFPAYLVGQRSMDQTGGTQKWGLSDYLCLHTEVDLAKGVQTSRYVNSDGHTVDIDYPFVTDNKMLSENTLQRIECPLD